MREKPMATLNDLRTVYTIDDLADMHEAMDIEDEIEHRMTAKSKADSETKSRRR